MQNCPQIFEQRFDTFDRNWTFEAAEYTMLNLWTLNIVVMIILFMVQLFSMDYTLYAGDAQLWAIDRG